MTAKGDNFGIPTVDDGIRSQTDLQAFCELAGLKPKHEHPPSSRMEHVIGGMLDLYGPVIADINLSAHPGLGSLAADWTHWVVIVAITDDHKIAYLDPAKNGNLQHMKYSDLEDLLVEFYVKE